MQDFFNAPKDVQPLTEWETITDEQIAAVRRGETVQIQGPKYLHTITLNPKGGQWEFRSESHLGILEADETNLRLFRFI